MLDTIAPQPRDSSAASTPPEWFVLIFALAIFVSAFLLFQVQPLISKYILPWFGGAPGVWTTAMLFFQVILFLGYCYSHLTSRWLNLRNQTLVHAGLLAVAVLLLPIIPRETWKPAGDFEPTWRILGLLGMTVGLPYFVLSSTGPLLQAWFTRAYHGRSPYRLYSLSNAGSLLALISYPVLIEPFLELSRQAWMWSAGFVLFVLAIAWCAVTGLRTAGERQHDVLHAATSAGEHAEPEITLLRRLLWVVLPALASLMLLATTNHVCQDVAVVPFLWVIPLGLYLLTFVICFDHERWYHREFWVTLTAVLVFLTAGIQALDFLAGLGTVATLALYFAAMFGSCMICHGELVRLRPTVKHLTEFYLLMSAGGALGGVIVSLVAPRVFLTFYEWNLGLLASFLLAVGGVCQTAAERCQQRLAASPREWFATKRSALVCGGILIVAAGATYCIADWQQPVSGAIDRARNFYGRVSVWEADKDVPADHHFSFFSGKVNHGRQFAQPEKRQLPTNYYAGHTGVGETLQYAGRRGPIRVGLVGLGVGTLATYARPGDFYRFYEINPEVTRIARKWFYYLSDCKVPAEVVSGDARLMLDREQDEPYDVLVLDAFSGDSIPIHLLTREAFEIYLRRLKPAGYLVVHITNSYLNLAPVVQRLADQFQLRTARFVTDNDEERLLFRTDYMVLSKNADFFATVRSRPPEPQPDVPLWTDHYSNLFQILKRP